MFRKAKPITRQPEVERPKPADPEGDGSTTQQTIREEPMLDRDRSAAASRADVSVGPDSGGTFLGADVEFKGSLKFKDQLRINGKFEGELSSSGTVHVGPQGDLRADVNVGNAVIEGKVNGNITASERVELRATAQMVGDITASKLIVEEGVVFVGRCEVSPDKARVPSSGGGESSRKREQVAAQSEIEVGLGA